MTAGEKTALLSHLELNLLILIESHTNIGNINRVAVDDILEDMYDILNDLEETLSPVSS